MDESVPTSCITLRFEQLQSDNNQRETNEPAALQPISGCHCQSGIEGFGPCLVTESKNGNVHCRAVSTLRNMLGSWTVISDHCDCGAQVMCGSCAARLAVSVTVLSPALTGHRWDSATRPGTFS